MHGDSRSQQICPRSGHHGSDHSQPGGQVRRRGARQPAVARAKAGLPYRHPQERRLLADLLRLDSGKLAEFNRDLRIMESVVRSLTLKVEPRLVEALVDHAQGGPKARAAAENAETAG